MGLLSWPCRFSYSHHLMYLKCCQNSSPSQWALAFCMDWCFFRFFYHCLDQRLTPMLTPLPLKQKMHQKQVETMLLVKTTKKSSVIKFMYAKKKKHTMELN